MLSNIYVPCLKQPAYLTIRRVSSQNLHGSLSESRSARFPVISAKC